MDKYDYICTFLTVVLGYVLGMMVSSIGLAIVLNSLESPIMTFVYGFCFIILGIAVLIAYFIFLFSQYEIVRRE
jgi:hypothetical protein